MLLLAVVSREFVHLDIVYFVGAGGLVVINVLLRSVALIQSMVVVWYCLCCMSVW